MASTRVTNDYSQELFVQRMFEQRAALEDVRDQLGSGIAVSDPGDDPGKAGTIAQFQTVLTRLAGHKERMGRAESYLSYQEQAMANAADLMIRAKEIANQAANETLSPEVRAQLAAEVFEIRDALAESANTQYLDRYVFGGKADSTPPFIQSTTPYTTPATQPENIRWVFDAATTGRTATRTIQITDADTVQITSNGQMFANAISGLERLGRALSGYRTVPEDLSTLPTGAGAAYVFPQDYRDQTTAIKDTIDIFDAQRRVFEAERSSLGGRMNRIQQALSFVDSITADTEKSRATLQDADAIELASEFASLENSLQALLASGSRIGNLSLLDFL